MENEIRWRKKKGKNFFFLPVVHVPLSIRSNGNKQSMSIPNQLDCLLGTTRMCFEFVYKQNMHMYMIEYQTQMFDYIYICIYKYCIDIYVFMCTLVLGTRIWKCDNWHTSTIVVRLSISMSVTCGNKAIMNFKSTVQTSKLYFSFFFDNCVYGKNGIEFLSFIGERNSSKKRKKISFVFYYKRGRKSFLF